MNKNWKKEAIDWIKQAENTNEFCEKCLVIEALSQLEKTEPNIAEAKRRLHQIIDSGSAFVNVPRFAEDLEKFGKEEVK